MRKVGAFENLLPKTTPTCFVNKGGDLRELDFRFLIGAPFNGPQGSSPRPSSTGSTSLRNALALGHQPDSCAD